MPDFFDDSGDWGDGGWDTSTGTADIWDNGDGTYTDPDTLDVWDYQGNYIGNETDDWSWPDDTTADPWGSGANDVPLTEDPNSGLIPRDGTDSGWSDQLDFTDVYATPDPITSSGGGFWSGVEDFFGNLFGGAGGGSANSGGGGGSFGGSSGGGSQNLNALVQALTQALKSAQSSGASATDISALQQQLALATAQQKSADTMKMVLIGGGVIVGAYLLTRNNPTRNAA